MVRHSGWVAGYIAILLFMAAGVFAGEGAVEFGDAGLKELVEEKARIKNPTAEDMLELWEIGWPWAPRKGVTNLKGLEHAKDLIQLYLESSPIQDFSVLTQLPRLEGFGLESSSISDLSQVVSAIESHDALRQLSFKGNQISDISPLLKLKSQKLDWIDLRENPLNEDAYKVVIPQLRKNFKGIRIAISFRAVQLIAPSVVFVVFAIAGVVYVIGYWKRKGGIFEIISGLLSAGVGCFFGMLAQVLYMTGGDIPLPGNGYENPQWVGGVVGGVFGLLAGLWFTQFLRGLHLSGRSIMGRGVLGGSGLGILCAVAVHVILMIAYRNPNIGFMLIGSGFGLAAGIAAGLVLAGCFAVGYKNGLIKGKETA